MIMPAAHNPSRGQTSLEYLLLLAVVAVVVIASFGPGSLIDQVHNSAQAYYNTVTRVIIANGTDANPLPIPGGWCPVTCPTGSGPNVIYGACECPAPAFGGAYCSLTNPTSPEPCPAGTSCPGAYQVSCTGVTACGACPEGQTCLATGGCGCADGLDCSSILNSSPDSSCTKCLCNNGTYWDPTSLSCDYCKPSGGQCTTSTNGTSCSPVTCPPNMNCNLSTNACQCNTGTYYSGPVAGCAYCAPISTSTCATSTNGTTCSPEPCAPGSYCVTTPGPNYNSCQCDDGFYWSGAGGCKSCGYSGCTGPCTPNCNNASCSSTCTGLPCSDGCGGTTCTGNVTPNCNNTDCASTCTGLPCSDGCGGTSCSGTENCTCGTCVVPPYNPPNVPCNDILGTNSCSKVCQGSVNQCPIDALGVLGTCYNGTCICGTCTLSPTDECGNAGQDDCHNPCTLSPPVACPGTDSCSGGWCYCVSDGSCTFDSTTNECGTAGHDNCNNACTLTTPVGCPGTDACVSGMCIYNCVSNGSCTLPDTDECGSSGVDNCNNPCTLNPPVACPGTDTCTGGWCYCTPQCSGIACGPDPICGQPCGTCPNGDICNSGQCTVCTTAGQCPAGAVCGPDTCGTPNGCGVCPASQICNGVGQCVCPTGSCLIGGTCVTESCTGVACGQPDNCGNPCNSTGTCPVGGDICSSGTCIPACLPCQTWNGSACVATTPCGTSICGTDSCGVSCGTCPAGDTCIAGACECTPGTGCGSNTCGPDQCPTPNPDGCGTCPGGGSESCQLNSGQPGYGQCITTFTLEITDFADCSTCRGVCGHFGLAGDCGAEASCSGTCNFSTCYTDPSGVGSDCGSGPGACLSETLVAGSFCQGGSIPTVISQNLTPPGYPSATTGTCGPGATPGTSYTTYTVVCTPPPSS